VSGVRVALENRRHLLARSTMDPFVDGAAFSTPKEVVSYLFSAVRRIA
jgi:hypothetical protein